MSSLSVAEADIFSQHIECPFNLDDDKIPAKGQELCLASGGARTPSHERQTCQCFLLKQIVGVKSDITLAEVHAVHAGP